MTLKIVIIIVNTAFDLRAFEEKVTIRNNIKKLKLVGVIIGNMMV